MIALIETIAMNVLTVTQMYGAVASDTTYTTGYIWLIGECVFFFFLHYIYCSSIAVLLKR
jgi:hypothetical protein